MVRAPNAPAGAIVLVDDDELVRRDLRVALAKRLECEVVEFGDPQAALHWLTRHHASIVLLDIDMAPMNGIEFAERLQAFDPRIPIAFITACDMDVHGSAIERIGPRAVLRKPVAVAEIARIVRLHSHD